MIEPSSSSPSELSLVSDEVSPAELSSGATSFRLTRSPIREKKGRRLCRRRCRCNEATDASKTTFDVDVDAVPP
jgi:hypothetical protein